MPSEGTIPRLPIELLERVICYIYDSQDLKACCLAARFFVPSAQAKLFRCIYLKDSSGEGSHTSEHLHSIISTHVFLNVRAIVSSHGHSFLPVIVAAMPKGRLEELAIKGHSPSRSWSSHLLQILRGNVFPSLTSLALRSVDAPASIVTSCPQLCHLEVSMCDLIYEEDASYAELLDDSDLDIGLPSSLEQFPLPIRRLTLDGTRNSDESLCPLVDFITGGRFPSLVYLDFHNRMPPYFPIRDFGTIMPPLMGQLCCLDLGHLEAGTWDSPHLDHLHLRNYPKLLFLGIRMKANGSRKLLHRLDWFSHMFESLTEPHPLRIFDIRFTTYLIPKNISNDSNSQLQDHLFQGWNQLDQALQNPNLSSLLKVGISMGLDREIIPVFEQNLSRLHEAGKLSFQAVNMDEFYWSLPKVTGR